MSSSFQTDSSSPTSRSTSFVPVDEAISPEVRTFGALFLIFWMLLLGFMFVTRRKQGVLRAEVERLEAALGEERVGSALGEQPTGGPLGPGQRQVD